MLFVCMNIFTSLEAWLFCKLVGITFGLGCDNLRCVILDLRLVCFPVFDSVDHFRDVSVRTADIGALGAIYIDCGVLVILGGPIGSENHQRWSCVLRYHSWDGFVIMTSSIVGLHEGKSSYFWSRADFICIHATCRGVIGYGG